ncbi:MAG: hypothetical protein MJ092_05260 [Lachnospiraceae bacterium]|nr:hypothetical protein [Lachnospiraceae bacterium]
MDEINAECGRGNDTQDSGNFTGYIVSKQIFYDDKYRNRHEDDRESIPGI